MKELTVNNKKLKLVEGNIVLFDVEAVVNAANSSLILGGGVAPFYPGRMQQNRTHPGR
jgi:hypothetical protein